MIDEPDCQRLNKLDEEDRFDFIQDHLFKIIKSESGIKPNYMIRMELSNVPPEYEHNYEDAGHGGMIDYYQIYFANGGDRNQGNIPEMSIDGVEFLFSVGGDDKKNSSSWILKKWQYYFEERLWGAFYNLFEEDQVKVKELIVQPGKGMSFQRHFKRNEIWMVSKGTCVVNYSKDDPDNKKNIQLNKFDHYLVPLGQWHQITNPFNEPCHLIEIQYGEACIEDDIERTEYYSPKA